jgi:hypothetical protein
MPKGRAARQAAAGVARFGREDRQEHAQRAGQVGHRQPDKDELRYRIHYRLDGQKKWR